MHTTGTYTIAADCTGDARYAGGDSYHLYAAPDGSTFSWLQTKGLRTRELFGGLEHRISANAATGDPASPPGACSAASLKGTYNYVIHGLKKAQRYHVPYVEVGHEIYDGAGNVATVSTNSLRRTTSHQFGTYSVHANCRGQAKYAAKKTKHWLFADPSGENASFLITDGAGTEGALGGIATRASTQTRSQLACSTQSLTGTYAYHARGLKNKKIFVETGFETYDGQGHFTNTYTDSHSRKVRHTTGTYTIAADCTGDARYAGGDSYHLYAAPDGSTFSWLQTKGLRTNELFGGLEHRISATPNEALTGERAAARATRAPQPRPDGVSIGGLFRFASVNFTPSVPAPSAACPNPTAEDPTCIQLKIDSSYTSYQGAPGTAGNEPTGVPLALNITFPYSGFSRRGCGRRAPSPPARRRRRPPAGRQRLAEQQRRERDRDDRLERHDDRRVAGADPRERREHQREGRGREEAVGEQQRPAAVGDGEAVRQRALRDGCRRRAGGDPAPPSPSRRRRSRSAGRRGRRARTRAPSRARSRRRAASTATGPLARGDERRAGRRQRQRGARAPARAALAQDEPADRADERGIGVEQQDARRRGPALQAEVEQRRLAGVADRAERQQPADRARRRPRDGAAAQQRAERGGGDREADAERRRGRQPALRRAGGR